MKKRNAFIGAILSLIPLGHPLIIKTGVVLSTTGLILSVPEKVNAESADFYFDRAFEKGKNGDHYGAISDYTKVIEINSNDGDAFYNRGWNKSQIEDFYGAISDYLKAIEINPNDSQAFNNIAFIKRKKEINDNYGSIFYATKALEIDPNSSNAYFNRGVAKKNIGDMNGACDDWRKASALGNEDTPNFVRNQC